jgi:hypothetical protein
MGSPQFSPTFSNSLYLIHHSIRSSSLQHFLFCFSLSVCVNIARITADLRISARVVESDKSLTPLYLFTPILHLKTFAIFWRCPQFSDYQRAATARRWINGIFTCCCTFKVDKHIPILHFNAYFCTLAASFPTV